MRWYRRRADGSVVSGVQEGTVARIARDARALAVLATGAVVIAEDAVPADHLGVGARVGQGVRRHASGRPERHAGGPGEELAHRHHRARTRSPRRLNMADAHTGASAERFEVRVTADSHFAWLRTRLALERTIMCLSAPRWDPTPPSTSTVRSP